MEHLSKYFIEASPVGYAYNKIIYSNLGNPIDYTYVEVNRSFKKINGTKTQDIIGQKGTQVLGYVDCQLIDLFHSKADKLIEGSQHEISLKNNESAGPESMVITFIHSEFFIVELQNVSHQTENLYHCLFDSVPAAIASVSIEGGFLDVNDSFCQLLGYEKENLLKMHLDELTHPEDTHTNHSDFMNMQDNNDSVIKTEKRVRCHSGTMIWVDLSTRLIKNSAGRPTSVVITMTNTTNLKKEEYTLRTSEENYKLLFDQAPLGYQSLDTEGRFIVVNEQWLQMLGYSREEVIGKWFGDFLAPSFAEGFKTRFPIFKKQGYIHNEFEMIHKNGTKLFIAFDGKIGHTYQGEFKQTHCILKDITKEHKLEQTLTKHRHLMNSLMDNTPDIIYIKDTAGKYLLFNNSAEKLSGKKASNILGKGVNAVFPPHIAENIIAIDNEVLEKKEIISTEEKVLDTSGEIHTYLSTKGPIFDENHTLLGMFGISRDITERIQQQQALLDSEKKYRLITENVVDVISIFNITKKKFTFISPSIKSLTGYTADESMDQDLFDIIAPENIDVFRQSMLREMEEFVSTKFTSNHFTHEVRFLHKEGGAVWAEISTRYQYNSDGEVEAVNSTRCIKERKKSEVIMRNLSYYDQLTGLYNRRFYEEELNRLDIKENLPLSLIMADLNGLKLTNDAFGHLEGDELLKKISRILKSECRSGEIISRIGGDEFVILLPKTNADDASHLIERLNMAVESENTNHGMLSISIGYAVKEVVNESMHKIFKNAEDDMYRHKLADSSSMRSKTINIIMNSLYEKSHREMLHSNRVSIICESIAQEMQLNQEVINQTKIAGLVHDIGKIGISNVILDKPGKLTREEWLEIKKHCEVGYRILSSVNEFSEIAEYVLSHQERWDGKGYPQGLASEAIPLQSRIITVADSFDAMTSDRTYRLGMSDADAVKEITRCMGTQFDPDIATIFINKVLPNM